MERPRHIRLFHDDQELGNGRAGARLRGPSACRGGGGSHRFRQGGKAGEMTTFDPLRSSKMTMGAAIALAAFALLGAPPHAEPGPPQCTAASDLVRFDRPLSRIAERIALGEPI